MKNTKFSTIRSIKIATFLLAVFFVIITALKVSAQTQDAQFRVLNENSFDINLIEFKRVEYVGECAGTVISPNEQKARFVSSKIPPGPNRKVIIRNITSGMENDPYPYTDRKYDKGEFSEDFGFKLGNSHKTKTFAVLEGENKFLYEIKENDNVIEEGSLTAQVSVENMGVFPRREVCQEKLECRGSLQCYDRKGNLRGSSSQRCFTTKTCSCN